jgi:hypothetical protein
MPSMEEWQNKLDTNADEIRSHPKVQGVVGQPGNKASICRAAAERGGAQAGHHRNAHRKTHGFNLVAREGQKWPMDTLEVEKPDNPDRRREQKVFSDGTFTDFLFLFARVVRIVSK